MIRVLHSIDTTGPGGAETVFVNLIKGLDAQKFEPVVVIRGPGWVCDALRLNGIEPVFVQSRGGFNIRYLRELVGVIRKHKIDIVQSHLLGSNLYCSLAGMICCVPVISTFHGFVDSSETERFMSIKVRIINWGARKIVFVSDMLRKHFVQEHGFADSKAVTIYNGVDTTIFKPQKDDSIRKELGVLPEQILIGAVGNIRPAKGYHYFLKAAKSIYEKRPECRFVIVGHGEGDLYRSLLDLRAELGLEGVCFFTGFRGDTSVIYNNLDLFVSPSISEGFSISTIEAMACGLPVVVTRSGGPGEIVKKCEHGIICDCNELSIASSVERILSDNGWRTDMILDTCNYVGDRFGLNSMLCKYEKLMLL